MPISDADADNGAGGPAGMISTYLWVGLGGALGSIARFWLGALVAELFGIRFPWGTILINVLGSFVIGFFAAFTGPGGRAIASFHARAFVMVGLCGGFTTFSSFSLQTLELARQSHWPRPAPISRCRCCCAWSRYGPAMHRPPPWAARDSRVPSPPAAKKRLPATVPAD